MANPPTTPNETDLMVAQAILDLETNIPDLTTKLRPLQISAACETDPGTGNEILRSPCRLNHWPGPNDA
ncbi:hypothetical protein PtB15_5B302 [Puccinia triticina]|nr:hypothetical protein PtB15_5B302 [Puccinia triticina]